MSEFLDDPQQKQQLDPGGVLDCVEGFTHQCRHGEELARSYTIPEITPIENALICGMGGSAIGGDLLRAYVSTSIHIPIEVNRNYTLPNYVSSKTLVLTSSYSGNTEETLSCYRDAKRRGAQIIAITTGGALAEWCQKDGYPLMFVPTGYAPRAALGYSFMFLLVLFEKLGLIPDQAALVQTMYTAIDQSIKENAYLVPASFNPAKQLAKKLYGRIPVLYAGQDAFRPIVVRWRAQLNENAKLFAHEFVVPEMNHNEILAWSHPLDVVSKLQAVALLDKGYHAQTQKRFQVMRKILSPVASDIIEVHSHGTELLARMASLISMGDFVSVYLAYLYKQDPFPIHAIDQFKQELAS